MIGGILLWAWVAGALVSLLPIARWWLREIEQVERGDAVEPSDIALAAAMAMSIAPLWPLLIPGVWIYHMLRMDQEQGP